MPNYGTKNANDPKESDKNSGKRVWKHLLAGSTAAIVSRTLTAPLDRLKTIAQARGSKLSVVSGLKMMVNEGGFSSMWRGNGTNLMKAIPEVTTRFVAFNEIKHKIVKEHPHELTTRERMFAGGISGLISHSIVHPIEVVKTRLVLRKTGDEKGFTQTLISGYKSDGYRFFFRGFCASMLGILIFSSIDFTTYENLKKFYKKKYGNSAIGQDVILCSMIAAVVAQSIAYPFAVIGVYLQTVAEPAKMRDIQKFISARGYLGMYRGLYISLLRGVPTFTSAYFSYELILHLLNEEMI